MKTTNIQVIPLKNCGFMRSFLKKLNGGDPLALAKKYIAKLTEKEKRHGY
jgi:hypothetical protein